MMLDAKSRPDGAPPGAALRFRSMHPDMARIETALARVVDPLTVTVGGLQVYAALDRLREEPSDDPWLCLSLGGGAAAVRIGWATAARLAGQVLEGGDDGDAALVLEDALAGWLDRIEAEAGLSLRFLSLSETPDLAALPIARSLRVNSRAGDGQVLQTASAVRLSPDAAATLARVVADRVARRADLPGLRLRLALVVARTRLTLGELASLRPGDAIVLPADMPPDHAVILEDRLSAPVSVVAGGIRLTGPFHALALSDKDAPRMQDDPTRTPAVTDPVPSARIPALTESALDDIEVQLSFLAGQTLIPLRDLRGMLPGAVVPLPMRADASVQIVVNGRVVGSGEIIEVGGQRAVQIRSMFAHE